MKGILKPLAVLLICSLLLSLGGCALIKGQGDDPALLEPGLTMSDAPEDNPVPESSQEEAPTPEPTPEPTLEPTPSPEEIKQAFVQETLEDMSLEERVGQMLFVAYRRSGGEDVINLNEKIEASLERYTPGGICLFGENIDTAGQCTQLISDFKDAVDIEPFIGVDEEGGLVSRLHASGNLEVEDAPNAGDIGASGDLQLAYDTTQTIAKELKELGFTLDFAPDADINTNPDNPVIGVRAYGTEPGPTADMVASALGGLMDNGMLACVKHFPGHGDTDTDTHSGAAVVGHDLERLRQVEFVPFQRAISEGVPFVMVAHIETPNVTGDDLPASMSKTIVTDLLREELGFDGIAITDALDMGAIAEFYSSGEVAVTAVQAGIDMLLMPADIGEAHGALVEAVEAGDISQARIDESVGRILGTKYDAGIIGPDKD